MSDWKNDRNLGPWPFVPQRNKWGYLNNPRWRPTPRPFVPGGPDDYDGRESEEPQVYTPERPRYPSASSKIHHQCGHWHHPVPAPGTLAPTSPPPGGDIETYIELLPTGIAAPGPEYFDVNNWDATLLGTFRQLDTSDYDGLCTFTFRVVGRNRGAQDCHAYLVDELGAIKATITIPAGTVGALGDAPVNWTGWDLFTYDIVFTPTAGDHSYALRMHNPAMQVQPGPGSDQDFIVSTARIIIRQSGATKSRVHIPMMDDLDDYNSDAKHYANQTDPFITDGGESCCLPIYDIPNYVDTEDYGATYAAPFRNIFKYESALLNNVSKVTFDAAIAYFPSAATVKGPYSFYGVTNMTWLHIGLYSSVAGLAGCGNNVGGNGFGFASYVDTCTGDTFTFLTDTDFLWSDLSDGKPVYRVIDLDPAIFNDGDGIYAGFCMDVLGGDGPDGPWQHSSQLFQVSIPAGRTITSAQLTYYVFYNSGSGRNECQVTLRYHLNQDPDPIYVTLWDKTADAQVLSSELVWNTWTPFTKKSVDINLAEFIDGHEYIVRFKQPVAWGGNTPYLGDANLWINVDPINQFSSWQRVTHDTTEEIFNFNSYYSWGAKPPGGQPYGVINNLARATLYLPAGAEVYYEATGRFLDGYYPTGYDDSWTRMSLYDAGVSMSGIGAEASPEIASSSLFWAIPGEDDGVLRRKRSGAVSGLVNGHSYIDYQPDANWMMEPRSGFIITKYLT